MLVVFGRFGVVAAATPAPIPRTVVIPQAPVVPPAVPALFTVQLLTNGSVLVIWQDNSYDERGFVIERSVDGSRYRRAGAVSINENSFSDAPLLRRGYVYRYRVRSFNKAGASTPSNSISIEPLGVPAAPTNLVATLWPYGPGKVMLVWQDNANSETGTSIERSSDGVSFTEIAAYQGINATSFFDSNLVSGATYWYRVQATGLGAKSDYSNSASVVAP